MEQTPLEGIRILPEDECADAKRFIELGERLNCSCKVRYATAHKTWKCVFSKKKPSRVLFTVEYTETWWRIKAMLSHLEQYKEELETCSENLVNLIKTAYDCRRCSERCKGPLPFLLDGVEYRKCLGCSFYFSNLNRADQGSLIRLLEREAAY